jgi:hypothetical protein
MTCEVPINPIILNPFYSHAPVKRDSTLLRPQERNPRHNAHFTWYRDWRGECHALVTTTSSTEPTLTYDSQLIVVGRLRVDGRLC